MPISEVTSHFWQVAYKSLSTLSPSGAEMLITDPNGGTHAPSSGEIFKNPTLAATLRSIAEHGKKGFYEGRVAEAIVERTFLIYSLRASLSPVEQSSRAREE